MSETTLNFLLEQAIIDVPTILRFTLEQYPAIDSRWLADAGYLLNTGCLAERVFVNGESREVFRNKLARKGSGYYYWEEEDTIAISPESLEEFGICYNPIARLLGETYCGEADYDILVENALWNIGVPDGGNAMVYLARNTGKNQAVAKELAKLQKADTVLWFGVRPETGSNDASLVQLSGFLLWENGRIAHKAKWPASITSHDGELSCKKMAENMFRKSGGAWELRYNGGERQTLMPTRGCVYLAKLLAQPNRLFDTEELAPPPANDRKQIDVEELLDRFEFGNGGRQNAVDRRTIEAVRKYYNEQKNRLQEAQECFDHNEEEDAQKHLDIASKYLNANLQKNGKARDLNKANRRPSQAIARDIKTVIKNIREFNEPLAKHLDDSLTLGITPIYAPTTNMVWQVSIM